MILVRRVYAAVLGLLLVSLGGCGGGPKYVKVTGVVTLDGKPYPNAIVSFQPVAVEGNPNPGRGSSALTDEQGRFYLVTDDGHGGAVAGKHRIRIRTKVNDPTNVFEAGVGSPDDPMPGGKKPEIEPIPQEWFADHTTKEFVVPPNGTDQANFDIVSKKAKK